MFVLCVSSCLHSCFHGCVYLCCYSYALLVLVLWSSEACAESVYGVGDCGA